MNFQDSVQYTYTTGLENEFWDRLGEDYDESTTLDFLNGDNFRTFGESLEALIRKKHPDGNNINAQAYLKAAAEEKGFTIASINTFTNWFKHSNRPKKSRESREAMFRIAFALGLNTDETAELFHKVYLDRAFDHRQYREVIYYYCIARGYSYQHAEQIIRAIHFDSNAAHDATLKTMLIKESSSGLQTDIDLIQFISTHPHNFNYGTNSLSGQEIVEHWREEAIAAANLEIKLTSRDDEYKNRSRTSVNFLYSVITNQPSNNEHGTKTTFKNSLLPKEIKQCFPQPSVFASKEPTYEEIRKMIILLFSYFYWCRIQYSHEDADFDGYVDDLNEQLYDADMSPLYAGNPFDWLFMRCAIEDNPLDWFRDILNEAMADGLD